ncbi:pyruvate dehydrogenase E2 component (dihydrolipoamide acetyltransferase) [Kribbella steppae]|uniref:Dihydrolipoamide acetyltransferase component of pyruvate dehydrogenase complex n=1 Tax=Kribbella steppae TaxID=2512223 RepID=A0A4R2HCL7_9ACTN|nr:dihydrolipoamide acetyltransferase family protein [Kribbella steppae]TCO26139.1 pyruvate dehydrogenase E2 component (dihydrolipoamide acetyltransferase) [Kribbella steppae]
MGKILMPRLSDTMESGIIAGWRKQPGDTVTAGEILADIETDKAVMEYEAYESGVLSRIIVAEGEEVAIGQPIAIVGENDDTAAEPTPTAEPIPPAESPPPVPAAPSTAGSAAPAAPPPTERLPASPLARRDAHELGVDLATLTGTGPGGRIIRADVRAAAEAITTPETVTAPAPYAGQSSSPAEEVPLGMLRRTSGKRLAESARTAPHFYLTAVSDVQQLVELRADLNSRLTAAGRPKISLNDLIVRACALTLRTHPDLNASLAGDALRRHQEIHIGLAVAVDNGLLVPVLRNVDRKSIGVIAQEATELAERARQRQLSADEMTGGTFTVSNLGMYGVEQFTAIINPPEAAILAVGASRREAVVLDDGSIAARTRMRYTLSADHRILDGAAGARFLADLTDLLENPWLILA